MKKTLSYLAGLAAIAAATLAGCSTDEVMAPVTLDSRSTTGLTVLVPDTASVITPAKAMDVAERFAAGLPASRSVARVAESVQTIADADGNPLMYIVNYAADRGYVILSASTKYGPVLAENDEGSFDLEAIAEDHPVNIWLDEQKYIVSHADALLDSITAAAASTWMPYTAIPTSVAALSDDLPQVYYDSIARWTQDPNLKIYTFEEYKNTTEYLLMSEEKRNNILAGIHYYGDAEWELAERATLVVILSDYVNNSNQLLSTTWHKSSPYNKLVPNNMDLEPSVVAVGQIMKYHKFPLTFSWDMMPDNNANDVVQKFLYALKIVFGSHTSTTVDSEYDKVAKALNNYGYKVTKCDHSGYKALEEVRNSRPIYMRGVRNRNEGGQEIHSWVCDGYKETYISTTTKFMTVDCRDISTAYKSIMVDAFHTTDQKNYNYTLHLNWGRDDGNFNAYYSDNNISIVVDGNPYNYTLYRQDILMTPK